MVHPGPALPRVLQLGHLMKKNASKTQVETYDVAEHLRTPAEMAAYLDACIIESGSDSAFIAKALGNVAGAQGMTNVARDAGV